MVIENFVHLFSSSVVFFFPEVQGAVVEEEIIPVRGYKDHERKYTLQLTFFAYLMALAKHYMPRCQVRNIRVVNFVLYPSATPLHLTWGEGGHFLLGLPKGRPN